MIRPEWVKCIADRHGVPFEAQATNAWCGRSIGIFDFHFRDIDHAAMNGRSEGRLVACSECTTAITEALQNGQEGQEP